MTDSLAPLVPDPAPAASDLDRVRLRVQADSPLTEITVFDGRFRTVEQGPGQLSVDLHRGPYKVEFRAGNAAVSRHVALTGEESEVTVAIKDSDLPIPTAAPLLSSSIDPGEHVEAAAEFSRSTPSRAGPGAQIFLFLRDPDRRRPEHGQAAQCP